MDLFLWWSSVSSQLWQPRAFLYHIHTFKCKGPCFLVYLNVHERVINKIPANSSGSEFYYTTSSYSIHPPYAVLFVSCATPVRQTANRSNSKWALLYCVSINKQTQSFAMLYHVSLYFRRSPLRSSVALDKPLHRCDQYTTEGFLSWCLSFCLCVFSLLFVILFPSQN